MGGVYVRATPAVCGRVCERYVQEVCVCTHVCGKGDEGGLGWRFSAVCIMFKT